MRGRAAPVRLAIPRLTRVSGKPGKNPSAERSRARSCASCGWADWMENCSMRRASPWRPSHDLVRWDLNLPDGRGPDVLSRAASGRSKVRYHPDRASTISPPHRGPQHGGR